MAKYKVSIVNYLNSAPFVHGLSKEHSLSIDVVLDHPSESAAKLIRGEVDIALAPVAVLPKLKQPHVLTDYCIGTEGEVKTVKIFSEVPIEEVQNLYLDYQSRTSVQLARILCSEFWKIRPVLIPAFPGFQKEIFGENAGLVIGDRAIQALGKYRYEYDLGAEWKQWTGLPFVFAVWMSNAPIDPSWMSDFSEILKDGLDTRNVVIEKYQHLNTPEFDVKDYLNKHISYSLDSNKRRALDKYLSLISV
ncbi:MAG: menaquinone biosynthesis protein [Bacteroidetes bacterium]|nr:menaquinone biosynthesis protein [Bacteroidota bacterium]